MVLAPKWYLHIPSCNSLMMYSAYVGVTHFNKGQEYPLLKSSSPIKVYLATFHSHPFVSPINISPICRKIIIDVIHVRSTFKAMHSLASVDGDERTCYNID